MTAAEAEALAGLLDGSRDVPLEERGATAVFETIAGGGITAEILTAAGHRPSAEDAELLRPGPGEQAARRWGLLRTAAGVPVAEVAVVLLPGRFPRDAGITPSGALPDGRGAVPLGAALGGSGARRRQLSVAVTPGRSDAAGAPLALRSRALLTLGDGTPIAVVSEDVYEAFLAAHPLPWHRRPLQPQSRAAPAALSRQGAHRP